MRWIHSEDFFREIRLPAVVETVFGYFLASYVPPRAITVAEFHNHNQFCYEPEEASDYMENGWYLHCARGHHRTWPLDCGVLRWAPVHDNDPALQWVAAETRKPPALETVLIKTPAGKFCAIYVPPLTVEPQDFLRFDLHSEFKTELWQQNESENGAFYIREGWHTPAYCDNGEVLSFPLAHEVSEWAWIPKVSTHGTAEQNRQQPEAQS